LFDEEGNSYYLETEERGLVPGEIIEKHLIKNGSRPPHSPFKANPHLVDDAPKYARPPQPQPPKQNNNDIPTAEKKPPPYYPKRDDPPPPNHPLDPENIPYSPVRVHPISPLSK
jgi:hypothetical protein